MLSNKTLLILITDAIGPDLVTGVNGVALG